MTTDYNAWRASQGLPRLAPKGPKKPHMFQLTEAAYAGLSDLASGLGYTYWGGGNVTALLEALGSGIWSLVPGTQAPPDTSKVPNPEAHHEE